MTSMNGQLLVATPSLLEPTFSRTVILLLEHNDDDGALGVVLNRPTDITVAAAVPAVADLVGSPAVLFSGGPVSPATAIALGWAGTDKPDGWAPVVPPLVTVDLDHDPASLAATLRQLRVFAGYAGWSAGQLERELDEGSWYVVPSLPADPFTPAPQRLRIDVLRRQGWPVAAAAHSPDDPTLN